MAHPETPAHAKGTIVQPPAAMVRQDWFLKAIAARPDFFLFGNVSFSFFSISCLHRPLWGLAGGLFLELRVF